MGKDLKTGDRVHLTVEDRVQGYHFGDKGTVNRGPCRGSSGDPYYVVAMDKKTSDTISVFTADEIEADD